MGPIHLQWKDPAVVNRFRTGVSLHSHTLHSRETLDFIYRAAAQAPILSVAIRRGERRYRQIHGAPLDLSRGWWTPPLGPHDAWLVEKSQIEGLGLDALVSLTDHDDIEAPVSLQLLDECRGTPVSFEWTVPYGPTFFHLGIHNLPAAQAREIFSAMRAYTLAPEQQVLADILAEVAKLNETLIIFNHPLWDEKGIGQAAHRATVWDFLRRFPASLHALELNGLRPWSENRDAVALAKAVRKPPISGGDRHAVEPNANFNLTNAATFAEFAAEVREGWSDVLILKHYREPFTLRIVQNMMDVLHTYEQHAKGWRLWSDRVFYACDDGQVRSLTELFGQGIPAPVAVFVNVLRFASMPHMRRLLRSAFPAAEEVAP
ncbi:MAG TPA: hypothetical protein VMH80_13235 [Bryobacteraceae bacterium]|nr:hypothetical protein [Bryobacteraceae bacterium]